MPGDEGGGDLAADSAADGAHHRVHPRRHPGLLSGDRLHDEVRHGREGKTDPGAEKRATASCTGPGRVGWTTRQVGLDQGVSLNRLSTGPSVPQDTRVIDAVAR